MIRIPKEVETKVVSKLYADADADADADASTGSTRRHSSTPRSTCDGSKTQR